MNTMISVPGEKHEPSNRTFQGIPGIESTASGRLYAVWYGGGNGEGPDNFVLLSISDNGGISWGDPIRVIDPEEKNIRAFDPALFCAPDGRLFVFWTQCCSEKKGDIFDGRHGVWISVCDEPDAPAGELVFSAPRRICDGVMMNKPAVLADGTWALPVSLWNVNHERCPEDLAGAKMVVSTDGGVTFTERGSVRIPADEASFDEHSIYEKDAGTLAMLIRTKHGYYEAFSVDQGYNWSAPVPSAVTGPNSRAFIGRLRSGELLLIRNDSSCRRGNMTAELSRDNGKTWYARILLDPRCETSYPDAAQLPDGRIAIIYDFNRYHGGYILCTVLDEDDIRAGKLTGSNSRAASLVHVLPHCIR